MKRKQTKSVPWKKVGIGAAIAVTVGGLAIGTVEAIKHFKPENNETNSGNSATIEAKAETLNEMLAIVKGDYKFSITEDVALTVEEKATVLGMDGMKNVTIDGEGKGSITAQGAKKSAIAPVEGGTLTFKNLTVNDKTDEVAGVNVYYDYLWLGGELRFENCTFTDSIYLKDTTKATFVNCTFKSIKDNYYSVWIGNGEASFERCTFTGYRGMKIHEFNESEDVQTVTVNKCLFDNLSEKPGMAIGKVDAATTVSITSSTFYNCAAWDTVGSLVGVDGIYECDTALETFAFEEKGNTVISE